MTHALATALVRADVALREMSDVSRPVMLAVLLGLLASGCWLALARGRAVIVAAGTVAVFGLTWFRVNQRWEGRILFDFSSTHGLTQADLMVPGLIGVALAVRGIRRLFAVEIPADRWRYPTR